MPFTFPWHRNRPKYTEGLTMPGKAAPAVPVSDAPTGLNLDQPMSDLRMSAEEREAWQNCYDSVQRLERENRVQKRTYSNLVTTVERLNKELQEAKDLAELNLKTGIDNFRDARHKQGEAENERDEVKRGYATLTNQYMQVCTERDSLAKNIAKLSAELKAANEIQPDLALEAQKWQSRALAFFWAKDSTLGQEVREMQQLMQEFLAWRNMRARPFANSMGFGGEPVEIKPHVYSADVRTILSPIGERCAVCHKPLEDGIHLPDPKDQADLFRLAEKEKGSE